MALTYLLLRLAEIKQQLESINRKLLGEEDDDDDFWEWDDPLE